MSAKTYFTSLTPREKGFWIVGSLVVIGGIVLLVRNRYQFLSKDTSVLQINTPYEKVQAMGAIPVDWGNTGARLVHGKYLFYPNNRAFQMTDDGKAIVRRGNYDKTQIIWDDHSNPTTLDIVFS